MLRLIIADDEDIIRDSLSKMLPWEEIGYQLVGTAKNGMEAYNLICDQYPDVVIIDIKMPILDGLELIERAQNLDKDIKFIILSGYGEFAYAKQAMKLGVKHYLLKPTDINQLKESLADIYHMDQENKDAARLYEKNILNDFSFPLQKSFLLEALSNENNLTEIISHYNQMLYSGITCGQLCICAYVEEPQLISCIKDIRKKYKEYQITEIFAPIYVHNVLVLAVDTKDISSNALLASHIKNLSYPEQKVSYEVEFLPCDQTKELLHLMIKKINRYGRILIFNKSGKLESIKNNISAPWVIDDLYQKLINSNKHKVSELLTSIFHPIRSLETAYSISLGLMLHWKSNHPNTFFHLSGFIEKLHSSSSVVEVHELTEFYTLRLVCGNAQKGEETDGKCLIASLKQYVESHLSAEHLSLKWLAEHHLYISVGYLSKLFSKEEGKSFSEYLTKMRMEHAKHLMKYFQNYSIQDIANEVGFGNNPRYFGQVFKKYTGFTPSSYQELLQKEKHG